MKRTGISILVIAVLLLVAYGGIAPARALPSSGDEQPAVDVAQAQGEPVTIQFLTDDEPDILLAMQQMAEAFAKSDPKYANPGRWPGHQALRL